MHHHNTSHSLCDLRSKICLLEPKRACNILILFKHLHVDLITIAAAMQSCNMEFFTDDVLDILMKVAPTDEVSI